MPILSGARTAKRIRSHGGGPSVAHTDVCWYAPKRSKIRQYYINDLSNYTLEERRGFLLLLAKCDEKLKESPRLELPPPCDSGEDTASSEKETYDRLYCCIITFQRTDVSHVTHLREAHLEGLPSTSKYLCDACNDGVIRSFKYLQTYGKCMWLFYCDVKMLTSSKWHSRV